MLAPGEALAEPGVSVKQSVEPAKLATDSTPEISFIEFDLVRSEQRFEFFFK